MKTIINIMKAELRVLFCSPIAWILLVVFLLQVGVGFTENLAEAIRSMGLGYSPYNLTANLIAGNRGVFNQILDNLYLYIPLLTMSLMSREYSSGTIKLLYSSPVSNNQIIFGKFASVIVYDLILCVALLIPMTYAIIVMKDPDVPMMFTALLGMFLTVAAYGSIGLFMSTITRYQVVAAVGSLVVLAVLNFIGGVGQDIDFVRDITYWLSIRGRSDVFISGMICTKDVVYFLLIIALFLSLSIIKLRGERLKLNRLNSLAQYFGTVVIIIFFGFITSRPQFIIYYDSTATKTNTITEKSQDVMNKFDDISDPMKDVLSRIKGEITITSYSNFLDDTWYRCSFSSRNYDMSKFERYIRFKPDIKMEYVFYWGEGTNKHLKKLYPDLTTEELFYKNCEDTDVNPKRLIAQSEIKDDISKDYGRFVRVIKCSNGKTAYLRKYDDVYVDPFESEITAAFKTLIDKSPMIAFVKGHGERGCYDHGDKGYGPFATNIGFRNALINQGFSVKEISLDSIVSSDVDVVVISDMKESFSELNEQNFDDYLKRGGNLFILGEPRRQDNMNPIVAKLGLKFEKGILVKPSQQYLDDIIECSVSEKSLEVSPYFKGMLSRKYTVVTPSACAVSFVEDKGFKATPILSTLDKGSWIEYKTTDFINEKSTIDNDEVEKSNVVMWHLTRDVDSKNQRIFVVGDADFVSTSVLTKSYPGMNSNNFKLITELFRNFSYDEYPVETPRVRPPDDSLNLKSKGLVIAKIFFIWILPVAALIMAIIILISRKKR